MTKIKFNNAEFTLESYNKTTYYSGETIDSNANCVVFADNITSLNNIALSAITVIQIKVDDTVIYDLQDINAHIDSISEYLSDNKIYVNVNLKFDIVA